jgi:hypothetical protein
MQSTKARALLSRLAALPPCAADTEDPLPQPAASTLMPRSTTTTRPAPRGQGRGRRPAALRVDAPGAFLSSLALNLMSTLYASRCCNVVPLLHFCNNGSGILDR